MAWIGQFTQAERLQTSGWCSTNISARECTVPKDRVVTDIGSVEPTDEWSTIDWNHTETRVNNLRRRIFRATKEQQWNKVRSLVKLMLRSRANLLLSVRKVTQQNRGRRTPGIDRQVILTSKGRAKLVETLLSELTAWRARPAKRVYIPKANGRHRPLGILTIKNRVAQAIVKNALEPIWEAQFEPNSYGFRPGRSCHDAVGQCWLRLKKNTRYKWVLDADLSAAFDTINHSFVLNKIGPLPGLALIKQWLQAGYVEEEMFYATTSGVPQGGVISPLIANIALDGLEDLLHEKASYIRYADDFVVASSSKEQLHELMPIIETFFLERGLRLNMEKTRITHVSEGFNFLGFTIRSFNGKCIIKPQKDKVIELIRRIRTWLKGNVSVPADVLIQHLNPILLGWANYYKHACSKRTFAYVDYRVWESIWWWCRKRHPKKSASWIRQKYFCRIDGRDWIFHNANGDCLRRTADVRIVRHIKVRGRASPDDPDLIDYWVQRRNKTPLYRNPLPELTGA